MKIPTLNLAVAPDPDVSEHIVSRICAATNLPRPEFFTVDQVVELLDAFGYAITPGTILEFDRKHYAAQPATPLWNSMFVHQLACALEKHKRWKKWPNPRHDGKKAGARLIVEQAEAEGRPSPWEDLDEQSLENLLLAINFHDERGDRAMVFEAIREKLARLGFIEE